MTHKLSNTLMRRRKNKTKPKLKNKNRRFITPEVRSSQIKNNKKNLLEVKQQPLSLWKKFKGYLKVVREALAGISLILGLFFFKDPIRELFMTKREVFINKNYVKGIFIPDVISSNPNSFITVNLGGTLSSNPLNFYEQGHELSGIGMEFGENGEIPFGLKLRIDNKRLYCYAIFKDIQKEEVVGIIDFKYWSLLKSNILDFRDTDQSLEVIDKYGNIVFNIIYQFPNTLIIQGYFISNNSIFVISANSIQSFEKTNKQGALDAIKSIAPIP